MRIDVYDEAAVLRNSRSETVFLHMSRTVVLTPTEPSCCRHCGFDVAQLKDCPDCGGCVMCCGCKPGEG